MESFLGLVFVLPILGFVLGGLVVAWWSFFQVRSLEARLDALEARPKPEPRVSPSVEPTAEPVAPPSAPSPVPEPTPSPLPPPPAPSPPPPAAPRPAKVPSMPNWQRRLLENWTGVAGLVVITLGIGFLALYAAAVFHPFGRFLLILALAVLSAASGTYLTVTRPRWARWGFWLQSFGAAAFLTACLGSSGLPGVTWVTDPLSGLVLLVLGVAANLGWGAYRRRQPYLTLHTVLALAALAVPGPGLAILVLLTITALVGIGASWFQRWDANRAVVSAAFQGILVVWVWFRPVDDPVLSVAVVVASVTVAGLVHLASYRQLARGEAWSPAAFLTHLVSGSTAALTSALWAPHNPGLAGLVLGALTLALILLSRRARSAGNHWLHRTDRLLALGAATVVLLLNPVGAEPLLVGAALLVLLVVFAWASTAEGDPLLGQISVALVGLGTVALSVVAFAWGSSADSVRWTWQVGGVLVAGLAAGAFLGWGPGSLRAHGPWYSVALAALPALGVLSVSALWAPVSPGPGVSPALVLILPWAALGLLVRRTRSVPLVASLTLGSWLLVLGSATTWFVHWGTQGSDPLVTLAWMGPSVLLAVLPLVLVPRTNRPGFLAVSLGLLVAVILGGTWPLAAVDPVLPTVFLLVLGAGALASGTWLGLRVPNLPKGSALVLAAALVVARIYGNQAATTGFPGLAVDLASVALVIGWACHRSIGPRWFVELALAGALATCWLDLEPRAFGLSVSVLTLVVLVLARRLPQVPRLPWYALALFLAASALSLPGQDLAFRAASLALLVVAVVVDAFLPGGDSWPKSRRLPTVLLQAATLAWALPSYLDGGVLTLGWSFEAGLIFVLALVWKDALFKNLAFGILAACLIRLLLVDLGEADLLVKALSFLGVGGLMVGMNVLYLLSQGRGFAGRTKAPD